MLLPKKALIATGDETQESYDGSIQFVESEDDPELVVVDGANIANLTTPETEGPWEPTFESLDEPWIVDPADE